ncbi:MAG: GNAT family N-acetyltransferase, partial [Fimbriimonadaceae bacterium]|nr:GNAT family N-acetyltransferase [Alphaproteobacteria bacterium]
MTSVDIMPRAETPGPTGSPALSIAAQTSIKLAQAELSVSVFSDLRDVEDLWRDFEKTAVASCYQRFDFVSAWFENIGRQNNYSPYIIVGHDRKNRPAFIWPLVLRRYFAYGVLSWPGGRHSNYNLGLSNRFWMTNLDEDLIRSVFRAAKKMRRFDAAHLFNQPVFWDGARNPFVNLPHIPSPSFAYCIDLRRGFEYYLETFRSPKFRKRLRWQQRKLASMGQITYRRAGNCRETLEFLDAHFAQKSSRFLSIGKTDPFAEKGLKSFLVD